jgi:hypothetical protein
VQDSSEVVLEDLTLIERPAVMLVLADPKPAPRRLAGRRAFLEPRVHTAVKPVPGRCSRKVGAPANTREQCDNPVPVEQSLELVDLALVDGQLGEGDDIDAADLLAGGDEHPVQEVEVETLRRRELEERERVLARPLDRSLQRAEVRRFHLQRPRQEQQVGVLGTHVRTGMAGRNLVPPGVDAGSMDAGVA